MKRPFTSARWLTPLFIIILALALAACERPLREDPQEQVSTPTTPVDGLATDVVPPTALPGDGTVPTPPPAGEGTVVATLPPDPGGEVVPTPADGATPGPEVTPTTGVEDPGGTDDPGGTGGDGTYTVQAGDTMFSIAQSFGLTVDELAAANNIANPNFIDVGDVLIIPSPGGDTGDSGDTGDTGDVEEPTGEQEYVIQPGDTLGKIAQRFGRTVEELVAYNNIDENTIIYAGETLLIPPSDWELPGDSGE